MEAKKIMNQLSFEKVVISTADFDFISQKIKNLAGINITEKKYDMIKNRMLSRTRELEYDCIEDYLNYLRNIPNNHSEWENFVNSLTTNKTHFFREPYHFDFLIQQIIPYYQQNIGKKLRVWCAAASTGEEPYTIALVLYHYLPAKNFEVLASDIDTSVLKVASNGVYSKQKVLADVPKEYQNYFSMGQGEVENWCKVKDDIKKYVRFKQHNILTDLTDTQLFNVVFSRNIFIYFTRETITDILKKITKKMTPKGHLVISHSESLQGLDIDFELVGSAIYVKK